MPMIGGDHFVFFQPIFNVADASLSVSVVVLILFYARYLATVSADKEKEDSENTGEQPDEQVADHKSENAKPQSEPEQE